MFISFIRNFFQELISIFISSNRKYFKTGFNFLYTEFFIRNMCLEDRHHGIRFQFYGSGVSRHPSNVIMNYTELPPIYMTMYYSRIYD